jgi:hypothetical protein
MDTLIFISEIIGLTAVVGLIIIAAVAAYIYLEFIKEELKETFRRGK